MYLGYVSTTDDTAQLQMRPEMTRPVMTARGMTRPEMTARGVTARGMTARGMTRPGMTARGAIVRGTTSEDQCAIFLSSLRLYFHDSGHVLYLCLLHHHVHICTYINVHVSITS